jgi:hypothetical protein
MLNAGFQNKSKSLSTQAERVSLRMVKEVPMASDCDLSNGQILEPLP